MQRQKQSMHIDEECVYMYMTSNASIPKRNEESAISELKKQMSGLKYKIICEWADLPNVTYSSYDYNGTMSTDVFLHYMCAMYA